MRTHKAAGTTYQPEEAREGCREPQEWDTDDEQGSVEVLRSDRLVSELERFSDCDRH